MLCRDNVLHVTGYNSLELKDPTEFCDNREIPAFMVPPDIIFLIATVSPFKMIWIQGIGYQKTDINTVTIFTSGGHHQDQNNAIQG